MGTRRVGHSDTQTARVDTAPQAAKQARSQMGGRARHWPVLWMVPCLNVFPAAGVAASLRCWLLGPTRWITT